MGYRKKEFSFMSIRKEDFVNFLLTGSKVSFPADDEGRISHLVINGVRKYEVVGKDFTLETTITFKGKNFAAKMTGRISVHNISGKIEFYANISDLV
jgi:hypothetical protein